MNLYKQIIKTSQNLMNSNGRTSTAEIKLELRTKYPDVTINQNHVSALMEFIQLNNDIKDLTFHDNGTFREYYIPSKAKTKTSSPAKSSMRCKNCRTKDLLEVLRSTRGRFCGITIKDGTVYNCKITGVKAKSVAITTNRGVKMTISPRKIVKITLGKQIYTRKKKKD